ncbi:MAG: hypothetical protein NE328_19155 [Lentisphaeraceae bacterium]|nr:hypothetical protein [Lentisphaeraceae bacterium]
MSKDYTPENDIPEVLEDKHRGKRVLFRVPGRAAPSEGIVEEFSLEKKYIRIGSQWLRNDKPILSFLTNQEKTNIRSTPYES